jgi:hypothetical protein
MKTYRWRVAFWAMLLHVALFVLIVAMSSIRVVHSADEPTSIYTRFATPLSSPANNGGKAQWTVKKMDFISNYPNGFDMPIEASSSAGKIVLAKVSWRHSTLKPTSMLVYPDRNGNYIGHWGPNIYQELPQWVGVDYWWTLTDERGNIFETPHGYAEYADNTRKWKRLVSEDAVIHWEASLPADVGPQIAAALKKKRDKFEMAWGKLLDYKPHIIIYASYKPWQEWMQGTAIDPQSLDGLTNPEWGATVQIYHHELPNATEYLAFGVVLHEMEHLYQQTFTGYDTYADAIWFFEGDATYFEDVQQYDYLERARRLAASRTLSLKNDITVRSEMSPRAAYDLGYAIWIYVDETYGPLMHRKIWQTVGKGITIDQAIKIATGDDMATFEQGFWAWLKAGK